MAQNLEIKNYSADGFDNDKVYPLLYRTSYFGGSDPTFTVPASPTFPDSRAGTPSRYIYFFPGQIYNEDLAGSYPVTLRDVTNNVTLNRVLTSPGNNEYRIVINTSSNAKTQIEFNVAQAGVSIAYSLYTYGSVMTEEERKEQTFDDITTTNIETDTITINNPVISYVILQDQKTAGTNGGTATTMAWTPRTINTEVSDTQNLCKLVTLLNYDNASSWSPVIGGAITGGTSGATATVVNDDNSGTTGTLSLIDISGTFQNNEEISHSGAPPGTADVNGTAYSAGQFYLSKGTYKVDIHASFDRTGVSRIRLYNITLDLAVEYSTGYSLVTTSNFAFEIPLQTIFTASSSYVYHIQYHCTNSTAATDLGWPSNLLPYEIYLSAIFQKLD